MYKPEEGGGSIKIKDLSSKQTSHRAIGGFCYIIFIIDIKLLLLIKILIENQIKGEVCLI